MKTFYITAAAIFSVLVVGAAFVFSDFSNTANPQTASVAQAQVIEMRKSPSCGCCTGWAEHMRERGFFVAVNETAEMMQIKEENNIPRTLESCHTSTIGGYVVEGHVPFAAVEKLLQEKPDVAGIAMAGMPAGSPGMGEAQQAPFEIYTITETGERGDLFMRI